VATFRVWFKDDSAMLVTAETESQARAEAHERAVRSQGVRPGGKDAYSRAEAKRWDKATTTIRAEQLT